MVFVAQRTWASGLRVRHLIQNAKVHLDQTHISRPSGATQARQKRSAHLAFEHDPTTPAVPATTYGAPPHPPNAAPPPPPLQSGVREEVGYAPVASHLPLPPLPPLEPSDGAGAYVGYVPGYDSWWPVLDDPGPEESAVNVPPHHPADPVGPSGRGASPVGLGMHALPSQDFTFGTQHFSPDFLQGMRNPVIHFPSAFAHHY